jgi:hypothetical protein
VRSSFGRVQDISWDDSKNQRGAYRKQKRSTDCDPNRHPRHPILAGVFIGSLGSGEGKPQIVRSRQT